MESLQRNSKQQTNAIGAQTVFLIRQKEVQAIKQWLKGSHVHTELNPYIILVCCFFPFWNFGVYNKGSEQFTDGQPSFV